VPFTITGQFVLVGAGVIQDEAAVQAMSRTGDRREILHGPLFYGLVFIVITLVYWQATPVGMVALMLMCGGDGLADIIGRRYGRAPLPWNAGKTWWGSAAMFADGWIGNLGAYLLAVSLVSLGGTLVESLPWKDVDNITVTLTAVFLGSLLF